MSDDIGLAGAAWCALGRQLAAYRRAAGLSQERLAGLADYSRSTIANVETGRQHVSADFWLRCDEVLGTGDALRRGFSEVEAAMRSERAQAVATARYQSMAVAFGGSDDVATLIESAPAVGADQNGARSAGPEAWTVRDPWLSGT